MPNTEVEHRNRILVVSRSNLFLFLRIGVVAAGVTWAIVWLSAEQRWSRLTAVFLRMNLGVFAAALGMFVVSQLMIALRWWLLLRTQSIFINYWAAVRLHFLGLFYNNFMPGAIGGDLLRAWYVTRHTDRKFEAALSVFVDRVIGLLGSAAIAVFFYSLFLRGRGGQIAFGEGGSQKFFAEHKGAVLWVAVALAVVFCGFMLHRRGRVLLKKGWSSIRIHSQKVVEKFKNAMVIYCRRPLAILTVFALTVFLQLLTITGFWFLGVNLGVTASVKYYYAIFPLGWAFGALPVSVGGAVVMEGLLVYLFINFAGVEAEPALAIALCQRIVWMIASLPGAAIHLLGAHLPAPTEVLLKDFSQS
jgi:uncharacterized protein (TIRG00374 family)